MGGDFSDVVTARVVVDLRRYARSMTRNADDADDVLQTALLRAARYWAKVDRGDPVPWLRTIVKRCYIDLWRRRQRMREVELPDAGVQEPDRGCLDARRALDALPDHYRAALELLAEGWSYAEIARATGIPVGTVMSRIHRGRALLREKIDRGDLGVDTSVGSE